MHENHSSTHENLPNKIDLEAQIYQQGEKRDM